MDVDRAGLAGVVVPPDVLEQLVAGERLARMTEEKRQELERLRLDRDRLPVAEKAMPGQIDLDPAEIGRASCRERVLVTV